MMPTLLPRILAETRRSPVIVATVILLTVIGLLGVLAPWIVPFPEHAGTVTDPENAYHPPSSDHWFGTDRYGRDVLSRTLYGIRVGPVIAIAVVAVSLIIGTTMGLLAGYLRGWGDEALMRITDVGLALPGLLCALALAAVLPPGQLGIVVALGATWWTWYARLVRGEALAVSTRPFVQACRILGLGHRRILLRHVLPNSTSSLLVQSSTDIGGVLLLASALSFLGLGPPPPTPDWGLMIEQSRSGFTTYWWVGTFPGLAILVVAALCYLLGDALRDRFDPRHTHREQNP